MSMTLMLPSGSKVYAWFGWPSLAVSTIAPFGVNVSMSGRAPTVT